MRRAHQGWLAGAAAALAAGAIGCGEMTGDPGTGAADPAAATTAEAATAAPSRALAPNTRFFIPQPDPGAVQQALALVKSRKLIDAARIAAMAATPQAVWFNGGTPAEVQASVKKTMSTAAALHTVPVLVSYNIPFRDCAQYSAGGALDTTSYEAWIDGFAAGIGKAKAVVILEPDSLGTIPFLTDWCHPMVTDASGTSVPAPGASADDRYAQLNYAVDAIEAKAPQAAVYLDGTHSHWLAVGDTAQRLASAGVMRAQGFYTNVSNYRATSDQAHQATWISKCIAFANDPEEGGWRLGHYGWCASQYYSPIPDSGNLVNPDDPSTWTYTDAWFDANMGTAVATTHFLIDTSRNGRGPLDVTPFGAAPYDQPAGVLGGLTGGNWCNPPGAGLGLRPTANTAVPLLDAYLWVKIPGESDGSCDIAGGARAWDYGSYDPWSLTGDGQNHFDPLWGMVDPDAGVWFPAQALQLAERAVPPLF
jgi:endoglucanase